MHSTHTLHLPDDRTLVLGSRPTVMGILNVTPDSFSDGGHHQGPATAVEQARALVADGADIVDIGGESTRPGAEEVGPQQELDRILPVFDALAQSGFDAPLSVDTYKALVADQAIQAGASIINDVCGLQREPEIADVAVIYGVPVIAMHWDKSRDRDKPLLDEMRRWFDRTLEVADKARLPQNQLVLDLGFGFGKTLAENYALLRDLAALYPGFPLLVGTSRKSMIGKLLDRPVKDRLAGTIATNVLGYQAGAHIFRVHEPRPVRDALLVAQATLYGPPQAEAAP